MAEIQARALYHFDGDPANGELSFGENDLLYIIRQDVGDGWWEAKNAHGDFGLVPESYVEIAELPWEGDALDGGGVGEPSAPPPPAPPLQDDSDPFPPTPPTPPPFSPEAVPEGESVISIPEPQFPPPPPPVPAAVPVSPPANGYQSTSPQDWGQSQWNGAGGNRNSYHPPAPQQQPSCEEWDDDWDDEDDQSSTSTGTNQVSNERPRSGYVEKSAPQSGASAKQDLQGSGNFGLAAPRREKGMPAAGDMSKYGTVKSSYNRFSHFAKSGGEAFMMGQVNAQVPESDLIKIIESPDGPTWHPPSSPYTCMVASPKKETKMKGLKSFIIYQLTPSFSNIVVSRRYKHFDWLHERLVEKFPCIPVPPLPDKAISGRYEDDFIQERMRQLQLWVNRMVCHPVISQSEVFLHFITCTDDKKWKQGKRKAERDEYQGGKFFLLLQTPPQALTMREVDGKMEVFCKFVMNMTENVKQLSNVMNDFAKKQNGPFRREYQKIGASFKQLAGTFNMDSRAGSRNLTAATDYIGDAYKEIGEIFASQPMKDTYILIENLHEYKGILQTFPDVLKVHEGAMGKAKECLSLQETGKMNDSEVQAVMQRSDVISFATMAEVNHFQESRNRDFKAMMENFLEGQIDCFKRITRLLETTQQHLHDA